VHNSTYKKLAVQWLNEALFFVSSVVLADSFVLVEISVLLNRGELTFELKIYSIANLKNVSGEAITIHKLAMINQKKTNKYEQRTNQQTRCHVFFNQL
jgi:hypothetical protein